jgi:16S rRNA (guanine527-N7)-methyltransferase
MAALSASLRGDLNAVSAGLALDLSPAQIDALLRYLDLLQHWNSVYNLTSVRDPGPMLTLHLADCLALVGPLRRHVGARENARLLDVGSGAGLPGVVIAALNPAVDVTCVEAVGKKAAFVRQVAGELGLHNLNSEHTRVEQLKASPFDVITSRAFASLADFVKLTRPRLNPGGIWLAMKGKRPETELSELGADVDVFHVEQLVVPGLDAQRCMVWMRIKQ